ncbi:hypothetical protein B0T14DRAFT_425775 [Immersiella caudata]|uniref:GH64 domain-containing protein n=1 Tax=Immersiella caudata TaxID=314043 RepID=A0AA39WWK5_9PEZI|nr:hypothetical protein B0T14DRAFT_425775 [Immersiella caudata]
MSTLEEVLRLQKKEGILQAPTGGNSVRAEVASSTNPTLQISLQNNTGSSNVWAYITGLDINRNNAVLVLRSDGVTPYYPTSPSKTLSPFAADCHIHLGAPGTTRVVTVPQVVGGRIWFCIDNQLTFYINPGPALVEPSVMNPSDPNYNLDWSFAEFTYNTFQLFANITYVDFVSFPVSLALTSTNPSTPPQRVLGHSPSSLLTIASALRSQSALDSSDWSKLIIPSPSPSNTPLRILSPNSAIKLFQPFPLFQDYFAPYVSAVWSKYTSTPLLINTQSTWGLLSATVSPITGKLTFPGIGAFSQPSAADIFSCDSGPFARYEENGEVMGNITARLAAAFNRSTVLRSGREPDGGEGVGGYYKEERTNHYARIVHGVSWEGRGYAFPYDDVSPSDAENVAGTVSDGSPAVFVVAVGGPAVLDHGERRGLGLDALGQHEKSDIKKNGSDLVVPNIERRLETMVPSASAAVQRRLEEWAERAADMGGPAVETGVRTLTWLIFWLGGLLAVSRWLLASRAGGVVLLLLAAYLVVFGSGGGVTDGE